ncbi:hypothetical protein ACFPZ0_20100 [Streptomonospora nanhaiensis]|uniref:Uncharacterized protein n=1 Tax=Streptomonospora nanhaiensis TaxID=1323731 RepID=A0A853BSC6_9ACTN|nr:hypothetical protein [Streptomonospora nanhaiensis]MBV2363825.1 hypothetical protein [Streptomonospora nanhaiensis]MBX9388782.1 hypothetical protein [Streptomonospora nanhaiensis]NYI97616.1 hypothetical protein [Streptomonospora nanhaiensis]
MRALFERFTGILIGSSFGTVFVLVNAHAPLPAAAGAALRVLALACLAATVVLGVLAARAAPPATAPGRAMFGRGYAAVVAAEALLLFGGFPVLRALGAPAEANVAWVALVVGLHFVALMAVWRERGIAVPGAVLTALGAAGFALLATPAAAWTPFVSGVLSGATLLACGLYVVLAARRTAAAA